MNDEFVKRLNELMEYYDLSPSLFADKIGVQRSSISHLLNGRNRPSLDFVMKVIQTFPEVNIYWLLNGKGDFPPKRDGDEQASSFKNPPKSNKDFQKAIAKIVVFYTDGTFESFETKK